tara:strand:+ start:2059 stop:2280 length:222 start_codon:yes stop_codon:yes gene_type:complete
MAIDISKLRLLSTRLNTNIDNLNKNKKFMHIPQKIMDEFVDIYIDLESEIKKSGGDSNGNGNKHGNYPISKEF